MKVQVMIPFHRLNTDTDHVPGDILEVEADELARIQSVDINMVLVLKDEVKEEPKKRTRKPKE